MCAVSYVMDQGSQYPPGLWTIPKIQVFEDLLKAAEKYDEVTGQPDCVDPQKAVFEQELAKIKARLVRLEELQDLYAKVDALEEELQVKRVKTDFSIVVDSPTPWQSGSVIAGAGQWAVAMNALPIISSSGPMESLHSTTLFPPNLT